jgi:hypothetical protein
VEFSPRGEEGVLREELAQGPDRAVLAQRMSPAKIGEVLFTDPDTVWR